MPRLRIAGRWNKRPCGANFGFGGRLAIYRAPNDPARRPRSSASLSVSRQISGGPADSTVAAGAVTPESTTGAEAASCLRPVHVDWVDCLDTSPIRGLKSALNCLSDEKLHGLTKNMVHWLDQILTVPLNQLTDICDKMAEICVPHLVNCNSTWKSPWEFLKAQFQPHTERRALLSKLLGFDDQQIHNEVESVLEQSSDTTQFEFHCPCQMGSNREVAIENLSALRLALVTNDLEAAIRLCMHRSVCLSEIGLILVPFPVFFAWFDTRAELPNDSADPSHSILLDCLVYWSNEPNLSRKKHCEFL
ncbi:unnamed protein product [Echinostoma caproni]|uniref:Uncharacterized protein n=1 Tax=Echinostoma caproni TaxID=27848 RepID=A0A183BDQ9_9TREM|nr:unnamed protein product [Echinostoma caproni]